MSPAPANIMGNPPRPLLPAKYAAQRCQFTSYGVGSNGYSAGESAEFDRVCLAVTGLIERACGRTLVRRPNAFLVFDGREVGRDDADWRRWAAIDLEAASPVEAVHNVWVDVEHDDPVDVVFDGTTLVAPADYRLEGPPADALDFGGWRLRLRESAHPMARGVSNVQIEATIGFEPKSTTEGYIPPEGGQPMPADLEEAMARQVALVWQRRANLHMSSQSVSTPGGAGTTAFQTTRLAQSVRELIQPYCTGEAALRLDIADTVGGAE